MFCTPCFWAFTKAAVIDLSKEVTDQLTNDEVKDLVQNVADELGVDTNDVNADIDYETRGSFTVQYADPAKADAISDVIKDSISQQIGAPVSDIDVEYDSDTGVVEYTVNTDSHNDSNNIKENLKTDAFTNAIETSMERIDSNINVTSPEVKDEVLANISIIVDTEDANVDMTNATDNLIAELSDDGFTIVEADGMFWFRI